MTFKQAISKARGYALCGNKAECQKWINQAAKRGKISHELLVSLDKTLRGGLKRRKGGFKRKKSRLNPGSDSSVHSPTSTSSDVRSPTSTKTSTEAYTSGNVTVTGGAGRGATTTVHLRKNPKRIRVLKGKGKCGCKRNPKSQTVVIVNRSSGTKSKSMPIKKAHVELARMLKNWRLDLGNAPFPYWIEAA